MGHHACRQRLCKCIRVLAVLIWVLFVYGFLGFAVYSLISYITYRPPINPVIPVKVDGVSAARFEFDGSTILSYDLALNLSTNGEYKYGGHRDPAFLIYKLTVRVFYGGVLLGYVDLVRPPTSPLTVPHHVSNRALPTAVLLGRVALPGDSAAAELYRRQEESGELFAVDLRVYLLASLNDDDMKFWITTSQMTLRRPSGFSSSPSSASSPSVDDGGRPLQKPTAPTPQPSAY